MELSALFEAIPWLTRASCSLLLAAVLLLWTPYRWGAAGVFGGAVLLAVLAGHIAGPALPVVGTLFGTAFALRAWGERLVIPLRLVLHLVLVAAVLALFSHQIPGFGNVKLIAGERLSPDSLPYSLYLNFDKPLVGFVLIFAFIPKARSWAQWLRVLRWALICAAGAAAVLLGPAFAAEYVRFDPKVPAFWAVWALNNLLMTCVAEEAFFRGYLQRGLLVATGASLSGYAAVMLAAFLFGLAHFTGGPVYVGLSTVAGFFYGMAYLKSRRIEAAILAHFGVNAIHFFLFSYPALSASG